MPYQWQLGSAVSRADRSAVWKRPLPDYLQRNRWFAGKARQIQRVRLMDVLTIHDVPQNHTGIENRPRGTAGGGMPTTRILLVRVEYLEGESDTYALPVVFAQDQQASDILGDRPGAGILIVKRSNDDSEAVLCDASRESTNFGC